MKSEFAKVLQAHLDNIQSDQTEATMLHAQADAASAVPLAVKALKKAAAQAEERAMAKVRADRSAFLRKAIGQFEAVCVELGMRTRAKKEVAVEGGV